MINSKHEILNPKQYGNSNLEFSKHVLHFGHLEFEFVSSFGIRISDFDLVFGDAKTFARLCKEFLGHKTRSNAQYVPAQETGVIE